jgi:hypothetical protein
MVLVNQARAEFLPDIDAALHEFLLRERVRGFSCYILDESGPGERLWHVRLFIPAFQAFAIIF